MDRLAVNGGTPVRSNPLPYGRQSIDSDDIAAVVRVLSSDWLTTGPGAEEFERKFAAFTGSRHAVAVSNGTAALHAACFGLDLQPGDEVIVPAITFVASANAAVYQGAVPVFADVDPETLLLDPEDVERKLTPKTKAIVSVDYAGQPCPYDDLQAIANSRNVRLLADACHSLGGTYKRKNVGTLADVTAFSLHPVKLITTGEGGVITTDHDQIAAKMRQFRNHGITTDHRQREREGSWSYEMRELGFNYRLTDFQCALGVSQLAKLPLWIARRRAIAEKYDQAFAATPAIHPLVRRPDVEHAYHLYVIELDLEKISGTRGDVFAAMRAEGIGVNVHYIPVHMQPFYRERFGCRGGMCPVAEAAYERILSLPIFPAMTDNDVNDVIEATSKVIAAYVD